MPPKQQRFCQEYIIDLNGTQSAIRAGYSQKTAATIAAEHLKKPQIQAEIQRLQAQRAERLDITANEVLNDLAAIAFTPITEVLSIQGAEVTVIPTEEWSDAAKVAVESVRQTKDGVYIKMVNKLAALEKLMQHLGLLSDLNVAIATLRTYGTVAETETGYTFTYSKPTASSPLTARV